MSLPRTSSRASFKLSTLKYIVMPNSKEKQRLKELEANGMQDTPDSELDSGISVNGNYDEPRQKNDPPEIFSFTYFQIALNHGVTKTLGSLNNISISSSRA